MSDTCPRRLDLGAFPFADGLSGPDTVRADGTCSYCGSITEEAFLAACVRGDELGPTDKSYKVYVDLPEGEPDALRCVSHASFDPARGGSNSVYIQGSLLTEAQREIVKRDGITLRDNDYYQFSPRGPIKHAKFYFQHLSQAGRERFIELINAKALRIGYPGHFYALPFFCACKESA